MPLIIPNTPVVDPDGLPDWDDKFPWIESRALKKRLEGVVVHSSTKPGGQTVPVRFVSPDFEIASAEYPGIYLSYGTVSRATDREVRGPAALTYAPPGYPVFPAVLDRQTTPYRVPEHPIPFNLDFNIAVMTRNYQQMSEIVSALQMLDRLPERFGGLEVPEDGTVRTLELLGGPDTSADQDADRNRLVTTLYSVRVAAELNLYDVEIAMRVTQVDLQLEQTYL